jgi:hypothetical protein
LLARLESAVESLSHLDVKVLDELVVRPESHHLKFLVCPNLSNGASPPISII